MQNVYSNPQEVELEFRYPVCFILQNYKNCGFFFLKPDLIYGDVFKMGGLMIRSCQGWGGVS